MTENELIDGHSEAYWILFSDLDICGCGQFDDRMIILKDTLNACPLYERENVPDYLKTPLGEWFLNMLDGAEIIEHGTSIGGAWLTVKGEKLRDALNGEEIWKEFNIN